MLKKRTKFFSFVIQIISFDSLQNILIFKCKLNITLNFLVCLIIQNPVFKNFKIMKKSQYIGKAQSSVNVMYIIIVIRQIFFSYAVFKIRLFFSIGIVRMNRQWCEGILKPFMVFQSTPPIRGRNQLFYA